MTNDAHLIHDLQNLARTIMPQGTKVWLYGSRAREDARTDSDWDILILLDKDKVEQEDFGRYSYPLIEFGWTYGADLSPQMYTRQEWDAMPMRITPYHQNVEQDKKVIYES